MPALRGSSSSASVLSLQRESELLGIAVELGLPQSQQTQGLTLAQIPGYSRDGSSRAAMKSRHPQFGRALRLGHQLVLIGRYDSDSGGAAAVETAFCAIRLRGGRACSGGDVLVRNNS